jgi:hypothetical protein
VYGAKYLFSQKKKLGGVFVRLICMRQTDLKLSVVY